MKLFDLFENSQDAVPLLPGEQRTSSSNAKLIPIQDKIQVLQNRLHEINDIKKDNHPDSMLYKSLAQTEERIKLNLQYLEKMKLRLVFDPQSMIDILNRDCSDFLKVVKETKQFLYRGLNNTESVFEGRTRIDRSPRNSNKQVSDRYDEALKNFGFKALRSNSIFTTSDFNFADNYGSNIYLIFPKNGFDFTYSNKKDLILDSWGDLVDDLSVSAFADKLLDWMKFNVKNWSNTDLGYFILDKKWSVVFRKLRRNFQIDNNSMRMPSEFNRLAEEFISDHGIIDHFSPEKTNLKPAMLDGREIMIHGEYWAFKNYSWNYILSSNYIKRDDS